MYRTAIVPRLCRGAPLRGRPIAHVSARSSALLCRTGGATYAVIGQAGRRGFLSLGCGIACAGAWAASRRSLTWCDEASLTVAAPLEEQVGREAPAIASAQSHVSLARRVRRSWRRWLRVILRCATLFCKVAPLLIGAPAFIVLWRRGGEDAFWWLLLESISSAGPTFIKLAQWASSRPDLLPESVIRRLKVLQAGVKPHSYASTCDLFAEAFGPDWAKFIAVELAPVGSGCCGQVYHGWILGQGAGKPDMEVAVKVRHPGAKEKILLDLEIMRLFATSLEFAWTRMKLLSIAEFVDHFEAFILPQADMRIEASNLDAFNHNFPFSSSGKGLPVRFPTPVRPYVSEAVLVMSYERATPLPALLDEHHDAHLELVPCSRVFRARSREIPAFISNEELRTPCCKRLGKAVFDVFMQMLFGDHFIHGDLHPGNIMVQLGEDGSKPELVIIDTGLAVHMKLEDNRNFVDLLHAVAMKDGERTARLMVERSPGDRSAVLDEEIFVEKVSALVARARGNGMTLGKYGLGDILAQMLQLAYHHRVKLETSFVTVVTSIIVVEGVARQLDPDIDVIESATPHLIRAAAAHVMGKA